MKKKGLFTLVAIMTLLIAAMLTGCGGKSVDISDAIYVYFDGIDGDGVAYTYVDASQFEDLISDSWKNDKNMDWGTLFSLSESLKVTLDKHE